MTNVLQDLPAGAVELGGAPKGKQRAISIMFTEGQLLRIARHVDKVKEDLPEGYSITRHAFMKQTILNAIHEGERS